MLVHPGATEPAVRPGSGPASQNPACDNLIPSPGASATLVHPSMQNRSNMSQPTSQSPLGGQVAVVTGAAQGLGLATSKRLAADGAHVILADLQLDKAEDRSGAAALLRPRRQRRRARRRRQRRGRRLLLRGALAALAASTSSPTAPAFGQDVCPVSELGDEEWDRVLRVTLTGTFHCCRAARPHHGGAGVGQHRQLRLDQRPEPGRPGQRLQCRQGGGHQPHPDPGGRAGRVRRARQRGRSRVRCTPPSTSATWRCAAAAWESPRRR